VVDGTEEEKVSARDSTDQNRGKLLAPPHGVQIMPRSNGECEETSWVVAPRKQPRGRTYDPSFRRIVATLMLIRG
jgi:hypothetical protein